MFILSSPSGAGKTTLTKKIAENNTNFITKKKQIVFLYPVYIERNGFIQEIDLNENNTNEIFWA